MKGWKRDEDEKFALQIWLRLWTWVLKIISPLIVGAVILMRYVYGESWEETIFWASFPVATWLVLTFPRIVLYYQGVPFPRWMYYGEDIRAPGWGKTGKVYPR